MRSLIEFWQYLPYMIDPIAFSLGPFDLRWYGIMYLLSVMSVFFLYLKYCKKHNLEKNIEYSQELLLYSFLGIIIGARLGYAFFYELAVFAKNPLMLINPFHNGQLVGISGLSYHGGAIGFLVAIFIYCKRYNFNFFKISNIISIYIPLGYTFGRIGNFLNNELYGRITTSAFGMYFPIDNQKNLRYPSQLVEALLEGIMIFIIIKILIKKTKIAHKMITPIYCVLYAIARSLSEIIREPDSFQVLIFNTFTYGQILSFLMIIFGIILMPVYLKNHEKKPS
jgi:phosphatidylglycerol---prolipoprotein diacylglyceryl transferase